MSKTFRILDPRRRRSIDRRTSRTFVRVLRTSSDLGASSTPARGYARVGLLPGVVALCVGYFVVRALPLIWAGLLVRFGL